MFSTKTSHDVYYSNAAHHIAAWTKQLVEKNDRNKEGHAS